MHIGNKTVIDILKERDAENRFEELKSKWGISKEEDSLQSRFEELKSKWGISKEGELSGRSL